MEALLLTVNEAAAVLRVSRSTAYGLVRSGKLKSIEVGRSRRIPRHALYEFAGIMPPSSPPQEPPPTKRVVDDGRGPGMPVVWLAEDRLVIDVAALREALTGGVTRRPYRG